MQAQTPVFFNLACKGTINISMNKYFINFLLLGIVFLESCMLSAPQNSRKNTLKNNLSGTDINNGATSSSANGYAADEIKPYWFDTQKIIGTMSINMNTQNIYYLRGKNVHDFLSTTNSSLNIYNYQTSYCMKAEFSNTLNYKTMWVRAIPLSITNFSTQTIERILRIDIPSKADNTTACGQITASAYSPPEICSGPSCVGKITTAHLNLYINKITPVPTTSLDLSGIQLQIDLQSNSSSTVSQCSNSSCSAKGFDCCIEGQCVMDATEKSSAKNDMSQYNQAKTEYAANPLSFINWPNIFYICSNIGHIPPPTQPTTPTTTPLTAAQTRVKNYLADYQCISDVSAVLGYTRCLPNQGATDYNNIKIKLAKSCGCTALDAEIATKCPDWGVRPLYGSTLQTEANIVDFFCNTPQPDTQMGPIVNLNVTVPNRSAPHRLYSAAGTAYDLITNMPKTNPVTIQEGTEFTYVDDFNKMSPYNGSFNINSVLGNMSVDLNHTLPAKSVTVEIGKSYILTATSGYYSPCPKCAKDSWFQSFFSFAPSIKGVGLQASGYTTSRDTYSDNSTLGNYEDTNFGRSCFVPVTMLPFAHKKEATLQLQRQNRLATQAAYYINGYQRDWYGFNQGALIGSFDGVTWFAVGRGRRITATTTKLYLAINAAFLDLADKTDTVVNIVPDTPNNTVADYDYDTSLPLNSAKQNQGATCQRFHQCTTDADCVTQLGWEYVCGDVSQYKTKWPSIDGDGNEIANQEQNSTLFEILGATTDTRIGTRCVYRGAGAPCKGNVSALNAINQKLLTCAPNFYCAKATDNAFNSELVRSPNEPNNILFGFDANVLGRPLNYVTASKPLPAEVMANLQANAAVINTTTTDVGMCRPGKSLDATLSDTDRHGRADTNKRSDYISQIANCDSSSTATKNRFLNCPVFDTDVNNLETFNKYKVVSDNDSGYRERAQQNSCGGEALYNSIPAPATAIYLSSFKGIESLSLSNTASIFNPVMAKDACLRRAGSVCHTDLDCGPNLMHEQIASTLPISSFGNTEAEQLYWKESLICGQGAPTPAINSADYNSYQLNKNRCCRDVGKDFTMFTEGAETGSNAGLHTSIFSYNNTSAAGRYSRYAVSPTAHSLSSAIPKINTSAVTAPAAYQWKVINETGSRTCCGGGYIRKFADGTHDWNKAGNPRLYLDAANFNCLNYRSPLATPLLNDFSIVRRQSYTDEYSRFCQNPNADLTKSGCFQIPYQTGTNANDYTIIAPHAYVSTGVIDTSVTSSTPATYSVNAPYGPVGYLGSLNYIVDSQYKYGASFYVPAYIGGTTLNAIQSNIIKVELQYFDASGNKLARSTINYQNGACVTQVVGSGIDNVTYNNMFPVQGDDKEGYCIDMVTNSSKPIMHVRGTKDTVPLAPNATVKHVFAGIIITFKTIEGVANTAVAEAGNLNYYLTKLGRLELIGIPQITYEPIYCNNDQSKVVPGIFKSTLATRAQFQTLPSTYGVDPVRMYSSPDDAATVDENTAGNLNALLLVDSTMYGNYDKKFTYQDKLQNTAIFSSKDFMCCTPLGMTPKNGAPSGCCSGFAVAAASGKPICKLPIETDLNVYFNRFVSNEGIGDSLPGANGVSGLVDTAVEADNDFNAYTGEPKLRDSTDAKIYALGIAYCDKGKATRGGAFGQFLPQPNNGFMPEGYAPSDYPTSIVDSFFDNLSSTDATKYVGKPGFDRGVRWNHHWYCRN